MTDTQRVLLVVLAALITWIISFTLVVSIFEWLGQDPRGATKSLFEIMADKVKHLMKLRVF